jgi:hypothetical protein
MDLGICLNCLEMGHKVSLYGKKTGERDVHKKNIGPWRILKGLFLKDLEKKKNTSQRLDHKHPEEEADVAENEEGQEKDVDEEDQEAEEDLDKRSKSSVSHIQQFAKKRGTNSTAAVEFA